MKFHNFWPQKQSKKEEEEFVRDYNTI